MNRLIFRLAGLYLSMLTASIFVVILVLGIFTYLTIGAIRMNQISNDAHHLAHMMEQQLQQDRQSGINQVFEHYCEVVSTQYDILLCDSTGRVMYRHADMRFASVDSISARLTDDFVEVYPLLTWLFPSETNSLVMSDGSVLAFQSASFRTEQGSVWLLAFPAYILPSAVVQRLVMFYLLFSVIVFLLITAVFGLILYRMIAGRLQAINAVVVELEHGNLDARVPTEQSLRPDDIALLGTRVNKIADVMQGFVEKFRVQDVSRRNLLANISHELRTPMMIAQGCMETILLHNGQMAEEKRELYVQSALREIGNLDRLVQQLFDLSALEVARDKAMQWENVPYDEFLYSIVMQHRVIAEQTGKTLSLEMPSGLPEMRIDPRRIISVVNNLLANAFRHTPVGGSIAVEVQYDREGEVIATSIRDTGEGIAAEHLPKVFEAFYRERKQGYNRKEKSGAGLGLMLCRQIVELHGGTIAVESTPGVCTTFVFTLPVLPVDEPFSLPDSPE